MRLPVYWVGTATAGWTAVPMYRITDTLVGGAGDAGDGRPVLRPQAKMIVLERCFVSGRGRTGGGAC